MSASNGSKKRKNKNKNKNLSGESVNKLQVTSAQFYSPIPRISSMSVDNTYSLPAPQLINPINQSTPLGQNYGVQPQGQMHGFVNGTFISPTTQGLPVDFNSKFDVISRKLDGVTEQLRKLDLMDQRLTNLEVATKSIQSDITGLKGNMSEMDKSFSFLNDQFEKNKEELHGLRDTVKNLTNESQTLSDANITLQSEVDALKERHIDLQARSMRDNLIFSGIDEPVPMQDRGGTANREDTEATLKTFLKDVMGLEDMEFHRVHRMGSHTPGRPRQIVAKFVLFKDREKVRQMAKEKLVNTRFGINEQFPREINDKRKILYPTFKAAKRQGKSARFVRDRLYVDGRQVFADGAERTEGHNGHGENRSVPRGQDGSRRGTERRH
ncbi:hypothetical protein FSP39_019590 [Pinctada imbricata]|uniref:Uncharacterized protein n=1 Tax=Pinctada imbricata TaxID=66713 RepID=A0AA88YFJ9_PINIB|nr:hypothetical protein FSP39_019590 [Pinctada imbricata]